MILERSLLMAFLELWSCSAPTFPPSAGLCLMTLKKMCWFYRWYWGYAIKVDFSFVLVTNLFRGGFLFTYNSFHTVEARLQSMDDYFGDSHRQTGNVSHSCGNMPGAPRDSDMISGSERLQGHKLLWKTCLCLAHLEKSRLRICSFFIENIISCTIYLCNNLMHFKNVARHFIKWNVSNAVIAERNCQPHFNVEIRNQIPK